MPKTKSLTRILTTFVPDFGGSRRVSKTRPFFQEPRRKLFYVRHRRDATRNTTAKATVNNLKMRGIARYDGIIRERDTKENVRDAVGQG